MRRLSRFFRRSDNVLLVSALVGGIAAGSVAVVSTVAQDWMVATWAALSAMWAFLVAARSRVVPPASSPPAPDVAPVDRGVELLVFDGGPLDGAEVASPIPGTERFLGEDGITVGGTKYRISAVHHTAYTVEAIR